MQTLDGLPLGSACRVTRIDASGSFHRRMLDLGITSGTKITALHKSISGNPIAYEIRGAVIALRKEDAKSISIQPL